MTKFNIDRFDDCIVEPIFKPILIELARVGEDKYAFDYMHGKCDGLETYHPDLGIACFWVLAGELSDLLIYANYSVECGYEQRGDVYWLKITSSEDADSLRNFKIKLMLGTIGTPIYLKANV